MNIQNMNLFNGEREQSINIAKIIKDKYDQSRKHTRDYSGLQARHRFDKARKRAIKETSKSDLPI